jgi:hypothetical protein
MPEHIPGESIETLLNLKGDDGKLGHDVYTVPSFASAAECEALIATATQLRENTYPDDPPPLCRLPLEKDDCLSRVLMARTLSLVEEQLPEFAISAFGQALGLAEMRVASFSKGEPAVNVYTAGGTFAPHTDKEALTIIIPLSAPEAFEGGGTGFWKGSHFVPVKRWQNPWLSSSSQRQTANDADDKSNWLPHDHILKPAVGTAIIFDGTVTHAGLPVTAGIRYLFVMSFTLRPQGTPCVEEEEEEEVVEEEEGGGTQDGTDVSIGTASNLPNLTGLFEDISGSSDED